MALRTDVDEDVRESLAGANRVRHHALALRWNHNKYPPRNCWDLLANHLGLAMPPEHHFE